MSVSITVKQGAFRQPQKTKSLRYSGESEEDIPATTGSVGTVQCVICNRRKLEKVSFG